MTTFRVRVSGAAENELGATLKRVLQDPRRSWRPVVRFEFVRSARDADIVVAVAPKAFMDENYASVRKDLASMSVTDYSDEKFNKVFFHADRWLRGPDAAVEVLHPATGKVVTHPRDRLFHYRTYLVNHELGHACGLPHRRPSGGICSVMTQQTLHTHGGRFNSIPTTQDRESLRNLLQLKAAARRK